MLTQTLVRVLCGYPSRTRGWANSWYLSWYLRSDPLVISPLGGVFPVVLVVTSMGFTIFYIIAAIAPASAKLQPRAVRHRANALTKQTLWPKTIWQNYELGQPAQL